MVKYSDGCIGSRAICTTGILGATIVSTGHGREVAGVILSTESYRINCRYKAYRIATE